MQSLLPDASRCAQQAAATLLRALLGSFTAILAQGARACDRDSAAPSRRQWLARWLARPQWEPETIYAQLNRQACRLLARRKGIPLLVDFTDLGTAWRVLQVSFPWQGRAIPLYRSVVRHTAPEVGQPQQVPAACAWLRRHLPRPLDRYVRVMDRGFPSPLLVRHLTQERWRFVLRISGEWKMTHGVYTGRLKSAPKQPGLVGATPRCCLDAVLGCRGKGRAYWSRANVVLYHADGAKEAWYLLTTERSGAGAVAIYAERGGIECEFRDLKGAWGLDRLARWQERARVARFLAWVAIYEWRLVFLWLKHRLWEGAGYFQVAGKLSWIQITRLWIQHQLRLASRLALARL
jgi:Transposase DDE domain